MVEGRLNAGCAPRLKTCVGCAGPLGGNGVRVRSRAELAVALERAIETRGKFQLIDAIIPRGAVSPTLARFVDILSRRQVNAAGHSQ